VHVCSDGVRSVICWLSNVAVVDCAAAGTVTVWLVIAAGPPLLLTVWPVKTCVSDVPAVLATVSVAV
jgi:hypothetical protein